MTRKHGVITILLTTILITTITTPTTAIRLSDLHSKHTVSTIKKLVREKLSEDEYYRLVGVKSLQVKVRRYNHGEKREYEVVLWGHFSTFLPELCKIDKNCREIVEAKIRIIINEDGQPIHYEQIFQKTVFDKLEEKKRRKPQI
ncbi:MAG: hypothetical protein DRO11_04295 [Methanobacteriota archaeon]|nr:MAG: hypothetical protein DRO11_04295 [Euryarchaeota archaeon]